MLMFSIRSFFIFLYSTATADLIFVVDYYGSKIYASSLSASGPTSLSAVNTTTSSPIAVDYDQEQGYIYWTDYRLDSILRARYDGTDQVNLIADIQNSYGLAIDLASKRVFWTDYVNDLIEVAYLNGTGRSTVVRGNLSYPRAIATDSLHGLLFWTDTGSNPKIERANMDGSNRLTVIETSIRWPWGIAIDPVGNTLYWCDRYNDKLETSDLFGDFREILLQDCSVGDPFGVAVHAEYLYWTDYGSGRLKRINRYERGGSIEQVGSTVFVGVRGLHVYEVDECSSNPCRNNGTCMDFIDSFQCSCLEGFAGTLCEDVDECFSSPCENNGTCLNIIDTFQCSCPEGFAGTLCKEDLDECSSDPCYPGGICVDEVNKFRCQCLPGYSGLLCENDINECGNSPCENNAICVDGFICICQPEFYGLSCETVYLCDDSICDKGDVCLNNGQEHICYNNNEAITIGTVLGYFIAVVVVIVATIIIAAIVFVYKRYKQRKKITKGSDSINMTVKDDGNTYDEVIGNTMETRAGTDAHNLNRVNTSDPQYINKIETKTHQVADSSYEVLHTYSNIGAVYSDLKK